MHSPAMLNDSLVDLATSSTHVITVLLNSSGSMSGKMKVDTKRLLMLETSV